LPGDVPPSSYIRNPDIDIHRMPPDTAVLITLEILDPGRAAVNYQLKFQPAVQ
jgi:hypothetical protein